ncbi:DUF2975 domain-containing protein [Sphingomonas sp. HITSZ_GF]|uniref:DUF2975 domain-containing protein n=1 Tax=Sphingomonas sp. HITSZ_GF TaxID=3037247 RepID=UPI00240E4C6E|nr:DUF2975 domain-containing protein [Sphingomonas sp. HITSZ_GF]MDG2534821.1 DUF2975 domain-containing protein [Sphingomonas sp. HITSZ_GF]
MAIPLPLARHARRLRIAAVAGAVALPLLLVVAALLPAGIVHLETDGLPLGWGVVIALVVILPMSAALFALAAMLGRIEVGDRFSPAVTRDFHRFTRLLLVTAIAETLRPSLAQLVAAALGTGKRILLGIDDSHFLLLIVALVLFLVARLFDEAARLEEDSRSIV